MHIRDFVSLLFYLISKMCVARLAYLGLVEPLLAWRDNAGGGACLGVQDFVGQQSVFER